MRWSLFLLIFVQLTHAESQVSSGLADQMQSARLSISETERAQREALSHLFVINKRIKSIAKKNAELNSKFMVQEGLVRRTAQEVNALENKSEAHKTFLNTRLRQLYQEQRGTSFQWLFSSTSPIEIERNHRFLKLLIDSDHQRLKLFLASLRDVKKKRSKLKEMVSAMAATQKQLHRQETELDQEMRSKSRLVASLIKSRDSKLTELSDLRQQHQEIAEAVGYAFFERKGSLRPPVIGPLVREYGTFVDPKFHFQLMHKGHFYATTKGEEVHAIFNGKVVVAHSIPGFGKTLILDHGDNYYSVYAFLGKLGATEGKNIIEGEPIATTGGGSPLFGPGLYFEIRHFTDAIDPRPWIKESLIKTAETH